MVSYTAKYHVTNSKYLQSYIYKDQKRSFELAHTCVDYSKESQIMDPSDKEVIFVEGNT